MASLAVGAGLTPAELVDLLIRRAPELRAAGVLQFPLEGGPVVLAAAEPMPVERATGGGEAFDPLLDPLDDPMTFGGGPVPGYKIPERPADEPLES